MGIVNQHVDAIRKRSEHGRHFGRLREIAGQVDIAAARLLDPPPEAVRGQRSRIQPMAAWTRNAPPSVSVFTAVDTRPVCSGGNIWHTAT